MSRPAASPKLRRGIRAVSCLTFLLTAPFARADEAKTRGYQPLPVRVEDFALKVEPGVALALTDPQSRIFKAGAGQTVKATRRFPRDAQR
jgi:hypothetical protein